MSSTLGYPAYEIPEQDAGARPHRWTLDRYRRAVELGLLTADDRVELINGELIEKMPEKPPHVYVSDVLYRALARYDAELYIRLAHPITIPEDSEPEPDVAVVKGGPQDYVALHPGPADVLLLIEVSDSTLRLDRRDKALLYGRAGIAEYWIVNVPERRLEIYRNPGSQGYGAITLLGEGEEASPLFAPDLRIRAADVLPPPEALAPAEG